MLLPNLGVALTETGRPGETESLLTKAIAQARAAGSKREALRAFIQLQSNCVYRSPTEAEIETALAETRAAADALQQLGDDVGLAEAAIAIEYLEWMLGRAAESQTWTLRGLAAFQRNAHRQNQSLPQVIQSATAATMH